MQTNKIDSYIGFAVKSRKAIFGLEMLLRARRPPYVIVYDEALGANSLKNMRYYCEAHNVSALQVPQNHLNQLLQRQNVKILSVLDESLAKAIIKNYAPEQTDKEIEKNLQNNNDVKLLDES